MSNQSRHHVRDGLYFSREDDGSVLIVQHESADPDSSVRFTQKLSRDVWESVVREMRERPVTGAEAAERVRKFHEEHPDFKPPEETS